MKKWRLTWVLALWVGMVICTSEIWMDKVLWLINLQLPSGNSVGALKLWSLDTYHWSGADHIINWSLYWITNSAHSSWRRKGRYTTMNLLIFYFLFLNYCLSSTYKKCCIHTKSVASTNKFIFIRFFNLFIFYFLLYKN